ncbi:glycoside hydrolase family 43 protein [Aaosphaeria arxii CBS 175.79]|uniref:Glycoside hydrolase family 43 protein n=1 Tax=Aaosphaeria arxii CBS 175.79 TaxID=1450172 RepID=A0A6A5XJJ3_9PLEO|nr:glycoside hydrolase family 43 protein [Aaosphaeria arxii CBS 175.79]KAF2012910.1 glycoside hydrolase family 43 protein [Aaosphaeria arxii CBS 175.79]
MMARIHLLSTLVTVLGLLVSFSSAATKIRPGADPTIMKVGDMYYSAEAAGTGIFVRRASSLIGLGEDGVDRKQVWTDSNKVGAVWAPQISRDGGRTYIYFTMGQSAAHRMYVIEASEPFGLYSQEKKLNLPDDQWAIDGAHFKYEGQHYFVWSGWKDSTNSQQNLYICKMTSPTQPTGARYLISQPAEPSWEQADGSRINEGPEPILDPEGRLHIAYSANGSWGTKYCIADLRLKKGGNPLQLWDWFKSNGCLFGSYAERMMSGWTPTVQIDGPGHNTWVMPNGEISSSPKGTNRIPFVFHGVPKGTEYKWANRKWFTGSFVWWAGTNYHRGGEHAADDKGYSFKFFE